MIFTSIFGIFTLVMLARALGFAKSPVLADAAEARKQAEGAIFGFVGEDVGLDRFGRGALVVGRDRRVALVRSHGDRWVVRVLAGASTEISGTVLTLRPRETMFGATQLDLGDAIASWTARLA
ncbi:MAG: hypothetical protein ACRYG4_01735 [Janthinobacterium lividum]